MSKPSRLTSIDQFRGFAILLMVLANFMGDVNRIPPWPWWNVDAPIWLAILQMAGLVAALSWMGLFMQRKKWMFTL